MNPEPYLEANNASVKEMEAAGIAHVATMFGVPLIAIKAITDIVDGDKPTQDEFMENLGRGGYASTRLPHSPLGQLAHLSVCVTPLSHRSIYI